MGMAIRNMRSKLQSARICNALGNTKPLIWRDRPSWLECSFKPGAFKLRYTVKNGIYIYVLVSHMSARLSASLIFQILFLVVCVPMIDSYV